VTFTFFITDLTGEWRGLRNDDLQDIFSLPDIFMLVRTRRIWWLWLVAQPQRRNIDGKGRADLENPGVDVATILNFNLLAPITVGARINT